MLIGLRGSGRLLTGFLLVLAGGCAAATKSSSPPPNPPGDVMRIYYATDRAPVEAAPPYFGDERGGLKFGRADVAVMINDRPGGDAVRWPATTRPAQPDNRWVNDPKALDVKGLLASGAGGNDDGIGDQPVMIFVHGYNVTPESAL